MGGLPGGRGGSSTSSSLREGAIALRAVTAASAIAWPRLSEVSSPGGDGEAVALVLATQEFVANTGGRPLRPAALECCLAGRTGSLGRVGQRGCWRSEAEFCWVLDTTTPSLRGSESLESSPGVSPLLSIQTGIGIRSSVRGWPRRPVHGRESLARGRISRGPLEQHKLMCSLGLCGEIAETNAQGDARSAGG